MNHKPDISKANACPPLPDNASGLDKLIYWLGIGLGSGLPKKAPGTWGTLGGMIVGVPLAMLGFYPFLVITILASIVGVWICERTSQLMGVHDDPHIVFDEWVGIWIAMLPIAYMMSLSWSVYGIVIPRLSPFTLQQEVMIILGVIAFMLFRLFDILKPFPISYCDKHLTGGFGIMVDDILAGLAVLAIFAGVALYMGVL